VRYAQYASGMKPVGVVTVRPRTAADDEFIAGLARPSFGRYSQAPAQTVASMIRAPAARTVVAESRGRLLGFAIVSFEKLKNSFGPWAQPVLASLDAIAVDENVQGGGVGRALLAEVERLARERQAVSLTLRTATANTRAQALFRRAGFQLTAPIAGLYRGGQNGLAMAKFLLG
jgi:ribosomal protein S18 acetylase RimI-like enzyme